MIVIDEYAEIKLLEKLEALKEDPKTTRCLHFQLNSHPDAESLQQIITEAVTSCLRASAPQLYIFSDQDVILLVSELRGKEYRALAQEIQRLSPEHSVTKEWVGFYELWLHAGQLIHVVEEKLNVLRTLDEQQRRLHIAQAAERKRQHILNAEVNRSGEEIVVRRKERSDPELMIIEDDPFSRRLVENVLQKKYHMTSLEDAENALNMYARIAPNILFLDINLPDVTGHELLEKIIAIDPESHVVMLSGNSDQENIMQAMKLGAKGFIAKPFTKEKLFQYIDRCPTISH